MYSQLLNPGGYGLTLISEPAAEPVDLTRAKIHLRIDHPDEDANILAAIRAARRLAETHCNKAWVSQKYRLTLPDWPCERHLELPIRPVTSVDLVKYIDAGGVEQTLTEVTDYQIWLDHNPPLILPPVATTIWPVASPYARPAVTIEFTVGSASAATVPEEVKQAILLAVGYWDENRGGEQAETPGSRGLPAGAIRLLDSIAAWD